MRRGMLATAAALTLLTGCGQPVEGTPVAGEPSLANQFDPCTIPDDAIARTGLDPQSEREGLGPGTSTREWKMCGWNGPTGNTWYSYQIQFSQRFTLEDVRKKADNTDFSDITVGRRTALQYRLQATDALGICNLAFDTNEGLAQIFALSHSVTDTKNGDLCEIVFRHTEDIEQFLPPS
ncbi:DUF3558 domain-containing protein [Rhodococcus sp. 1168]|uniref:DUF3558 domain-containing protein n=1 Tax=Rhodococcus sp. 1168 TaxID=2018041 RepID=UPI000A0EBAAA|nr:DUF3558 domain-containing protein [Rhodococcus sp. 1168]ORI24340.1 hypothetical protein BJI47_09300 [Rhodococcus sp. 1168]